MTGSFLDKIRTAIQAKVDRIPDVVNSSYNQRDFCKIFDGDSFTIIAEIKYKSPSQGQIYKGSLTPVEIAKEYLSNGASALSVLTESEYFGGNIEFIERIHKVMPDANILLKDFVLDVKQINQAVVSGANAVLLIVAFLDHDKLHELYNYAISIGLTPLVEVHNIGELRRALDLNPRVVGVNNRDLKTLKVDLEISRTLIREIPAGVYAVCESGITSRDDIEEMIKLGFDGFLIGQSFMEHEHPGKILADMLMLGDDES